MAKPGFEPRRAAVDLLNAVVGERKLLSELLPDATEHLDTADRARAARLAGNCLRWMDRADRMLGPFLRQKPPLQAHNILRLALVEIYQDGQQSHGVVDTAVDLARSYPDSRRTAGLVNAVLRRASRLGSDAWNELDVPRLPKWLRKPLLSQYGKAIVADIELAHSRGAPLDLTAKGDPADLAAQVSGMLLPTGSVRLADRAQITELPGYESGAWWVQDAAAALAAKVLAARPDERVLDMCAAPGGKAMQLAAAGARVSALDNSERRMVRAQENFKRTGLTIDVVVEDALTYSAPAFDAILLDAPCSATGTIRRHPDLPYAKDGSGMDDLQKLQARMIGRAIDLLKPGGRLVYCTCSLLRSEGEDQIENTLRIRSDVLVDTKGCRLPGVETDWIGEQGMRTRPDYLADTGGMDGFFIALLRKRA